MTAPERYDRRTLDKSRAKIRLISCGSTPKATFLPHFSQPNATGGLVVFTGAGVSMGLPANNVKRQGAGA